MSGSQPFRIRRSDKFESSFKKLKNVYKSDRQQEEFTRFFVSLIAEIASEPRHPKSTPEPLPKKFQLPTVWEFRKLRFKIPKSRGASGLGRLMYLINFEQEIILLDWVYTHEEFEQRPPDDAIKSALKDALAQVSDDEAENATQSTIEDDNE